MATTTNTPVPNTNSKQAKLEASYRGFSCIGQEIEREIAMQWFTSSSKTSYSQRNFLLKKEGV